ncbi:hypothetical protein N9N71_01690 [Synechococcus sp. AH-229-G18]|nr:hypothetical protein [Synechococcus sp. AH-229-G18]
MNEDFEKFIRWVEEETIRQEAWLQEIATSEENWDELLSPTECPYKWGQ